MGKASRLDLLLRQRPLQLDLLLRQRPSRLDLLLRQRPSQLDLLLRQRPSRQKLPPRNKTQLRRTLQRTTLRKPRLFQRLCLRNKTMKISLTQQLVRRKLPSSGITSTSLGIKLYAPWMKVTQSPTCRRSILIVLLPLIWEKLDSAGCRWQLMIRTAILVSVLVLRQEMELPALLHVGKFVALGVTTLSMLEFPASITTGSI